MGRGSEMYCRACRARAYMGYGSYTTWLDDCRTVAEVDARAAGSDLLDLAKNQRVRRFLERHQGHDVQCVSGDIKVVHNNNLYTETGFYGAEELAVEGYGEWTDETEPEARN